MITNMSTGAWNSCHKNTKIIANCTPTVRCTFNLEIKVILRGIRIKKVTLYGAKDRGRGRTQVPTKMGPTVEPKIYLLGQNDPKHGWLAWTNPALPEKMPQESLPLHCWSPLSPGCQSHKGLKAVSISRPSSSTLECPVKHSFITNWDDMKKTWYHSFYNKSPKLRPSFFIEVPIFKANREKKLGGSSLHRRQTGSTIESSVQLPAREISILSA